MSSLAAPRPPATYVVGIGASAGGLEAVSQLIGRLSTESPCAYVVLQHLSPNHRSMLVEILGRETTLRVKEAEQGDVPEAGVIYVVPANCNALLRDGHLSLASSAQHAGPKPSVNQFLISLAEERGDTAVGIVLSGTGSDGTAGLRAIQAAGGFTFAQRPETAKYDGMPRAAIEAGVAEHVQSPEEIAQSLRVVLTPPQTTTATPRARTLWNACCAPSTNNSASTSRATRPAPSCDGCTGANSPPAREAWASMWPLPNRVRKNSNCSHATS